MSEPAFTPGPYGIDANINVWVMAGQLHVATIPRASDGDWSQANARLIASSPDLYAVAKAADEFVSAILEKRGEMNDAAYPAGLQALPLLKQIRAALGKVEGEGK